jgi:hypothetical protein
MSRVLTSFTGFSASSNEIKKSLVKVAKNSRHQPFIVCGSSPKSIASSQSICYKKMKMGVENNKNEELSSIHQRL